MIFDIGEGGILPPPPNGEGVKGPMGVGLVYQIQNAPVKQGDNAPNASKCSKPMKGM